jgi:hypothetical protein
VNPIFDIIIPTYNNPQYLGPCVESILGTGVLNGYGRLIIVNNGQQPIRQMFKHYPQIVILDPGKNLGWEGGLALGLEHSKAPFVVFQNDDTFIPKANLMFYQRLLTQFNDRDVAAVGPATTVAAGWHSIFKRDPLRTPTEVSFLIFFTVMVRRADLDQVGGIDTSAPGGDDIDLSIRFRKAGKRLLVNPDAFLIHHGFKTGERVHGGPLTPFGWNNQEFTDRTNRWLIQKHGFRTFIETQFGLDYSKPAEEPKDLEGDLVRVYVKGSNVIELGCGFKKTVPYAIGVDRVDPGLDIPHVPGGGSVADIVADVTKPLPIKDLTQDTIIARHILEHCIDTVQTLKNWNRVLKIGGRLVVAVPDENVTSGIPMNPEHCHAFTQESLASVMELCGFKTVTSHSANNSVSFVGCYEKVLNMGPLENANCNHPGEVCLA